MSGLKGLKGLSLAQAEWAQKHDWFRGAINLGGDRFVVVASEWQEGLNSNMNVQFSSWESLKAWAGY